MQVAHTNQEWLQALTNQEEGQAESIEALRALLLRAALYTLSTHLEDLRSLDERERLALAEDCAQDALLAVLAHLDDFRGDSKFTTWAYKFGVNFALTRARQERWKKVSLDELSDSEAALDWLQWKEGFETGDSELPALQEEIITLLQEVIRAELTDRQRQVLKWIAFEDVPMDVVVQRLNTNRNAVYKLLHDARIKVKYQLATYGYAVEDVYELFKAAG